MWSSNYKLQRGRYNFRLLPWLLQSVLIALYQLCPNSQSWCRCKVSIPKTFTELFIRLYTLWFRTGKANELSNHYRKNKAKHSQGTIVSYPFNIFYIIYLYLWYVCVCIKVFVCVCVCVWSHMHMPHHGCGCLRMTCKSWCSFHRICSQIKVGRQVCKASWLFWTLHVQNRAPSYLFMPKSTYQFPIISRIFWLFFHWFVFHCILYKVLSDWGIMRILILSI